MINGPIMEMENRVNRTITNKEVYHTTVEFSPQPQIGLYWESSHHGDPVITCHSHDTQGRGFKPHTMHNYLFIFRNRIMTGSCENVAHVNQIHLKPNIE